MIDVIEKRVEEIFNHNLFISSARRTNSIRYDLQELKANPDLWPMTVNALLSRARAFKEAGNLCAAVGLCSALYSFGGWDVDDVMFTIIFASWPHFSGYTTFPVASGDIRLTPSDEYSTINGAEFYAKTHPYGRARLALLDYVINTLEKMKEGVIPEVFTTEQDSRITLRYEPNKYTVDTGDGRVLEFSSLYAARLHLEAVSEIQ